ncbi:MAG: DUF3192 domain-containing protein [Candidatus Omnitrophota bacterium]
MVKKIVYLLLMFMLISGCAGLSMYEAVSPNKSNLAKLRVDMPEDEAMKIMGDKPISSSSMSIDNPYRVESMEAATGSYKIVYYVTQVVLDDDTISDEELTPIVFKDGKLVGWGWNFMENLR